MKALLIIIMVLIVSPCITTAQESPVPDFICLLNGKLSILFFPEKAISKPEIKSCFIKNISKNTDWKGIEKADTSLTYKVYYSPNGEIEAQFQPYSGYVLHNLEFNKKGNIILKEYETSKMKGCGNYHWQERGDYHIQYLYKKDNCVRINYGKNSYFEQVFNKKGQLLSKQHFYRLSDTSQWEYAGSNVYTYDNKNRLQQEYTLSNYLPNSMDSFKRLPPNMLRILLRQSNVMRDSIMLQEFGVTDDSLYYNQHEYPESLTDKIDKTDEEDEAILNSYKEVVTAYIGYEYNKNGLPERRYSFTGDALISVEYFNYDSKDQLIEWQTVQDYDAYKYNWNHASMIKRELQYNRKNQVVACTISSYSGSERSHQEIEENRKSTLKVENFNDYTFEYDGSGKMMQMIESGKRWYYLQKENIPSYDSITYFMTYETF